MLDAREKGRENPAPLQYPVWRHRYFFFVDFLAEAAGLAAFFAVFVAMTYPPFPGGLLAGRSQAPCVRSQRWLPSHDP